MAYNNFFPAPMYNNQSQAQAQRLQKMRAEIDEQLAQLQMQQQVPQIQQNFITPAPPNPSDIPARWVDTYEDVKNSQVYVTTIFMDKNKSKFYIKDGNGNIKSYAFTEVEELDEKDLKIRELENRLAALEGGKLNEQSVNANVWEHNGEGQSNTTNDVGSTSETESSSI